MAEVKDAAGVFGFSLIRNRISVRGKYLLGSYLSAPYHAAPFDVATAPGPMRLIQFLDDDSACSVGAISDDGRNVRRIGKHRSSYALARAALAQGAGLEA